MNDYIKLLIQNNKYWSLKRLLRLHNDNQYNLSSYQIELIESYFLMTKMTDKDYSPGWIYQGE
jgi:hypothetical protein